MKNGELSPHLSLVIKVFEEGRWVRKRVNIDAKDQMNYEREIRRRTWFKCTY